MKLLNDENHSFFNCVTFPSILLDDINRLNRNRLLVKFEKYFTLMNDELIQAINGIGSDRSRKILKTIHLKK
jgi:hypothetical protein